NKGALSVFVATVHISLYILAAVAVGSVLMAGGEAFIASFFTSMQEHLGDLTIVVGMALLVPFVFVLIYAWMFVFLHMWFMFVFQRPEERRILAECSFPQRMRIHGFQSMYFSIRRKYLPERGDGNA